MRKIVLMIAVVMLASTLAADAGTFDPSRIAPEWGIDTFTRGVAREQLGRDLFADPYSTVTFGSLDVFDVFPYVESRTFQIVSDPRWNRLIYGERGGDLRAFDGKGSLLGVLSEPRGLAVDESNRVYVADAGNDRVEVLQASTEFGGMVLVPLYEIVGLSHPQAVAYSDGGTPFVPGDDFLYVADTGRNRIAAFALGSSGARPSSTLGELGSGPGRFAGPLAIAAGRSGGANTPDVYVADAHTRRIVHLRQEAGGLRWVSDVHHDADVVTALATDAWGNLYAAAPNRGLVRKFNPGLAPVAELRGVSRPRGIDIPFFNVRDHRVGSVQRVGQSSAIALGDWTDATGVSLWTLGVEVRDLAIVEGRSPSARFQLTDRAQVNLEVVDAATGESLARRAAGTMDAGSYDLALSGQEIEAAAGAEHPVLRVTAASSYSGGPTASAQAAIAGGAAIHSPSRPMLLGNWPNPLAGSTRIALALPAGVTGDVALRIYDAMGRQVRAYTRGFSPGRNEVVWDGADDRGRPVAAGVYLYRLTVGERALSRRMLVVR